MSTDPAPETSRLAKPEKGGARSDRLWPWYLITALYLSICGVVLYDRASEFGEFLNPADSTNGRLRLNEIGDIAAGIFAPLAFLWLFVATQLQRRELSLQRAELAETRAVLADQQRELEISAKESAHQTEIMRLTLNATIARTIYDEFSIKLYYLSKVWLKSNNAPMYLRFTNDHASRDYFLSFDDPENLSQDDPTIIDRFFDHLWYRCNHYIDLINERTIISVDEDSAYRFESSFMDGVPILLELTELSKTTDNVLIRARAAGVNLEAIARAIVVIETAILARPNKA